MKTFYSFLLSLMLLTSFGGVSLHAGDAQSKRNVLETYRKFVSHDSNKQTLEKERVEKLSQYEKDVTAYIKTMQKNIDEKKINSTCARQTLMSLNLLIFFVERSGLNEAIKESVKNVIKEGEPLREKLCAFIKKHGQRKQQVPVKANVKKVVHQEKKLPRISEKDVHVEQHKKKKVDLTKKTSALRCSLLLIHTSLQGFEFDERVRAFLADKQEVIKGFGGPLVCRQAAYNLLVSMSKVLEFLPSLMEEDEAYDAFVNHFFVALRQYVAADKVLLGQKKNEFKKLEHDFKQKQKNGFFTGKEKDFEHYCRVLNQKKRAFDVCFSQLKKRLALLCGAQHDVKTAFLFLVKIVSDFTKHAQQKGFMDKDGDYATLFCGNREEWFICANDKKHEHRVIDGPYSVLSFSSAQHVYKKGGHFDSEVTPLSENHGLLPRYVFDKTSFKDFLFSTKKYPFICTKQACSSHCAHKETIAYKLGTHGMFVSFKRFFKKDNAQDLVKLVHPLSLCKCLTFYKKYDCLLRAIVFHIGDAENGHHFVCVKQGRTWCLIDGQMQRKLESQEAKAMLDTGFFNGGHACMLFFKRRMTEGGHLVLDYIKEREKGNQEEESTFTKVKNYVANALFGEEKEVCDEEISGDAGGLDNLGLTCYLNAALQAILSMPEIVDGLREALELVEQSQRDSFLDAFVSLTQKMAASSKAISPKAFYQKFLEHFSVRYGFRPGIQGDSTEVITPVLDKILEFMKSSLCDIPYEDYLTCPGCGHTKTIFRKEDTAKILTLNIVKTNTWNHKKETLAENQLNTLNDALNEYFKPERMQEEVSCDPKNKNACGKKLVGFEKRCKIKGLSQYFIVSLKRFARFSGKDSDDLKTIKKLKHKVTFPAQLDLTRFLSNDAGNVHALYNLKSIVFCSGDYLYNLEKNKLVRNGGHYFTVRRDDNGNWVKYDDQTVTVLKPRALDRMWRTGTCRGSLGFGQAYALVFERSDSGQVIVQQELEPVEEVEGEQESSEEEIEKKEAVESSKEIKLLEKHLNKTDDCEDKECEICFDADKEEPVMTTQCNRFIHESCFQESIYSCGGCPFCKPVGKK